MDIHVVRAGETVSSVAARYGVPAGILAGVNGVAPRAFIADIQKKSRDLVALRHKKTRRHGGVHPAGKAQYHLAHFLLSI